MYGITVNSIKLENVDTIQVVDTSYSVVIDSSDTSFVINVNSDVTDISISLKTSVKANGSLNTGTLASDQMLFTPDSTSQVIAISIQAIGDIADAIKSADITIPGFPLRIIFPLFLTYWK